MDQKDNKEEIKKFVIKLIAITVSIIIIINVSFNTIFADKLNAINMIFSLNEKENIDLIKNKIRHEISEGIKKDKILNNEDKKLLINLYNKIKKEIESTQIN
jgi:hypothetical protein